MVVPCYRVGMACWCHVDCVVAACVVFFFQVVASMLCFTMMCPLLSSSLFNILMSVDPSFPLLALGILIKDVGVVSS